MKKIFKPHFIYVYPPFYLLYPILFIILSRPKSAERCCLMMCCFFGFLLFVQAKTSGTMLFDVLPAFPTDDLLSTQWYLDDTRALAVWDTGITGTVPLKEAHRCNFPTTPSVFECHYLPLGAFPTHTRVGTECDRRCQIPAHIP